MTLKNFTKIVSLIQLNVSIVIGLKDKGKLS